ncbi:TIGR03759 family integrating conjugative element protein [Pseudomonas sp. ICMP22404]|uniref:TIGR03759 family integrating conjugative element protein n=1 Tax=Pseudomonas sp. ICMP22404 TaxID=2583807 RepID=UPI001119E5BF|nr:TIGR03759 family integrating conjugative element protein [Pseudomonas sp. ICMP22404]TNF78796.1 TIGR03759 family integrating conjugative element protein [Pseudomonas sp. ICMP22404]
MSGLRLLNSLIFSLCFDANANESATNTSIEANAKFRADTTLAMEKTLLAQQWGLQQEELDRFDALMRGPLGTYSPNLDPLSALGIEAPTDAERQRYARLQVEAEALRVEKLLGYQRAYDQAWKDRYPGMSLINLPPISSPLMFKPAERKSVFVRLDCPECDQKVRQLYTSGAAFDLYVLGSEQDDKRIRQWAQKVGIKPKRIRDGNISINHDNGRWASIGAHGDLPAVMQEVNGQWLRQ